MTSSRSTEESSVDPLIRVHDLSIGYGDTQVLSHVSFDAPRRGVFGVMGPSGAGKSTLLRTLGRWNHGQPSFRATGSVICDGREILAQGSPAAARKLLPILPQKARLYGSTVIENLVADVADHAAMAPWQRRAVAQAMLGPLGLWEEFMPVLDAPALSLSMAVHKKLLIARLLSTSPSALLADEPLSDISVAEEGTLREFIKTTGRTRLVMIVLHNKQQARALCDTICLLTGGGVAEVTSARQFFDQPRTELGRRFLESGSCWPAAADADSSSEGDSHADAASIVSVPEGCIPPREFHWVIKGRLAGVQRPGLLGDVDEELARLAAFDIKVLVSLTEEAFDPVKLRQFGVEGVHVPVPDMGVPTTDAAFDLCRRISAWMDAGRPTALHCRAGLGRTGTLLAATLMYRGLDAVKAIEKVRLVNPRYIQSDAQLQFVHEFAAAVRRPAAM